MIMLHHTRNCITSLISNTYSIFLCKWIFTEMFIQACTSLMGVHPYKKVLKLFQNMIKSEKNLQLYVWYTYTRFVNTGFLIWNFLHHLESIMSLFWFEKSVFQKPTRELFYRLMCLLCVLAVLRVLFLLFLFCSKLWSLVHNGHT